MWNKFISKIDFLWKGDKDSLMSMWFTIILCLAAILELILTIKNVNHGK